MSDLEDELGGVKAELARKSEEAMSLHTRQMEAAAHQKASTPLAGTAEAQAAQKAEWQLQTPLAHVLLDQGSPASAVPPGSCVTFNPAWDLESDSPAGSPSALRSSQKMISLHSATPRGTSNLLHPMILQDSLELAAGSDDKHAVFAGEATATVWCGAEARKAQAAGHFATTRAELATLPEDAAGMLEMLAKGTATSRQFSAELETTCKQLADCLAAMAHSKVDTAPCTKCLEAAEASDALKSRLSELEAELGCKAGEAQGLQDRLVAAEDAAVDLAAQLAAAATKAEDLAGRASESEAEADSLREQLLQLKPVEEQLLRAEQSAQEMAGVLAQSRAETAEMEEKLRTTRRDAEEVAVTVAELEALTERLKGQQVAAAEQLAEATARQQAEAEAHAANSLGEKQQELEALATQLAEAQAQAQAEAEAAATQQAEAAALTATSLKEKELELGALSAQLAEAQAQAQAQAEAVAKQQVDAEALREKQLEVEALGSQLAAAQAEKGQLTSRCSKSEAFAAKLEERVKGLQIDIGNLERARFESDAVAEQARMKVVEVQEAMESQIEAARAEGQQRAGEAKLKSDAHALGVMKQLQAKAADAEAKATTAMEKAAAADSRCVAAEALASEKSAEVASLSSRLERLQRIQKQKRTEYENMQAQLASVGAKLQESEGRVKTLESEAAALKTDVESSGTAASREMAGLKGKITAAERERDRLREQLAKSQVLAKEREQWDADRQALSSELEAARAQLAGQARDLARLQGAEEARRRLQNELAETTVLLADTEARLRQMEEEADNCASVTEAERARTAAAARAWQEELGEVLRRGGDREAWPECVRRVVEERERISARAAERELRKDIEHMEGLLEENSRATKEREADLFAQQREAAAVREAAEERLARFEAELAAREEAVRLRLSAEAEALARQLESLQAQLDRAQEALASAKESAAAERKQHAQAAESLQGELRSVRAKARQLMTARDHEVAALKARLRGGEAGPAVAEPAAAGDAGAALEMEALMGGADGGHEAPPEPPGDSAAIAEGGAVEPAGGAPSESAAAATERDAVGAAQRLADAVAALGGWASRDAEGKAADLAALQDASAGLMSAVQVQAARVGSLEARVAVVEEELAESEHTHDLRDKATAILKDELAELRRNAEAAGVDTVYLKRVLIAAFESGELACPNDDNTALTIVSRLLHFSDSELQRCGKPALKRRNSKTGWGLF